MYNFHTCRFQGYPWAILRHQKHTAKKGIRLGGNALPRFYRSQILGQILGFLILPYGAPGDRPGIVPDSVMAL